MNMTMCKKILQSINANAIIAAFAFVSLVSFSCFARATADDSVDSTGLIFNDAKVNSYNLHFYVDNWVDTLEYYYINGEEYIPAQFTGYLSNGDSIVLDSVGVRYKGNSSYTYSANSIKKPFKFSFDEYVKDQTFCGVSTLNFSNGIKDPSQMREKLSYDIIRQYVKAPRAAFATISVDHNLVGLYTQVEQVDKKYLKRNFDFKNGNLYKASDDGATLEYLGDTLNDKYLAAFELKTNSTANDWSSFISMLDKLNNSDASTFVSAAGSILDLDVCIRYLAFNMVFSNFDSYTGSGRNFYMYDDSVSGKFVLVPWDLNFSFGIFTNGWNVKTADVVNISNLNIRPLIRRVLENDSLKQVYLKYISEMIHGCASYDSVSARVDKLKELIDPYVSLDTNKFNTYEQFVTNCESDVTVSEGPTKTVFPGLKSFATVRGQNIQTQLDGYLPVKYFQNGSRRHCNFSVNTFSNAGKTVLSFKYEITNDNTGTCFSIFNSRGCQVAKITENNRQKGVYQQTLTLPVKLAPGFYTLRMKAGTQPSLAQSLVIW